MAPETNPAHQNHGHYRLSERLVDLVHRVGGGFHAGYRAVHARGRFYGGTFVATPEAKAISRAVHLQGEPVPVTVRHSASSSGDPFGVVGNVVSMATKFYLPDGRVTDMIGLNIPVFFARTPDEFVEIIEGVFDSNAGRLDPYKMQTFLAGRPTTARAFQLIQRTPAAVSFAQTAFHPLHAFRFVNAANELCFARYHWEPDAGVAGQSLEEAQKLSPDYLYDELEARLRVAPVSFTLILQLAEPDDPTDDSTVLWPDTRRRVVIGRLEITRPTSVEEIGDPVMLHDPTRLTDGIEPSDDPVLAARRGAYEVSVAHRTGGWQGRQAALNRAGRGSCPFGAHPHPTKEL